MSKSDPVATNPNDQMPAGEGLAPDQIVPEEFEDEKLYPPADKTGTGTADTHGGIEGCKTKAATE